MTLAATAEGQSCDVHGGNATIQIALLRHGHTDFHGRFCGHSDPGLSEQGREQIPAMIESLSHLVPNAICCSDLRRAVETAEPIAKHFGLDYRVLAAFREMNFGAWEGLTWKEVERQHPEDARAWAKLFPHHRPPGGESFLELQARVVDQLEELAKHAEPGCRLIVTHAGVIRTAVGWILGVPDKRISRIGQDHGGITLLEKVRNHWSVTAVNAGTSRFAEASCKQIEDRP